MPSRPRDLPLCPPPSCHPPPYMIDSTAPLTLESPPYPFQDGQIQTSFNFTYPVSSTPSAPNFNHGLSQSQMSSYSELSANLNFFHATMDTTTTKNIHPGSDGAPGLTSTTAFFAPTNNTLHTNQSQLTLSSTDSAWPSDAIPPFLWPASAMNYPQATSYQDGQYLYPHAFHAHRAPSAGASNLIPTLPTAYPHHKFEPIQPSLARCIPVISPYKRPTRPSSRSSTISSSKASKTQRRASGSSTQSSGSTLSLSTESTSTSTSSSAQKSPGDASSCQGATQPERSRAAVLPGPSKSLKTFMDPKAPKLACSFCRSRKIACGTLGPGLQCKYVYSHTFPNSVSLRLNPG